MMAGMAAPHWQRPSAAHHTSPVKGALFLSVGVIAATGSRRLWLMLLPVAIMAVGLGGLSRSLAAHWRNSLPTNYWETAPPAALQRCLRSARRC